MTDTAPVASDRSWAAFTERGPWTIERADAQWLSLASTLRTQARAEVPALTAERRVPPGMRVLTVVGRLGKAVLPWLVRKKLGRHADPAASRADISLGLRKAAES